jgi:protein subunit release factor B
MKAFITKEKEERLRQEMKRLKILEADLRESFILGSGRGGQKVNRTASCVQLQHVRSGINIKCQRSRSRAVNRYLARKELCERIDELARGRESARVQRIEKIRRQKRRRSRRAKQKMLDAKRRTSEKKKLRRPVSDDG